MRLTMCFLASHLLADGLWMFDGYLARKSDGIKPSARLSDSTAVMPVLADRQRVTPCYERGRSAARTANPCFSKRAFAVGERRNARNAEASACFELAVMAAG